MFSFRAAFFASLVSSVGASVTSYAGYEPITVVTDHAAISSDQKFLEGFLAFLDDPNFAIAQNIYANGGNSKSYAELTLVNLITQNVAKGTTITGTDGNGATVVGTVLSEYTANDPTISLQYPTADDNDNWNQCRVGGLPQDEQLTSGCLVNDVGEVTISGLAGQVAYSAVANKNARTIKGFSTGAGTRMRPGDNVTAPYFSFFQPYVDYYGQFDFGDEMVAAAFSGGGTTFTNGNINLAGYDFSARSQIVKKIASYVIVGLYVQRELFDAIYDCNSDCSTAECNDDAVHAGDEAAAFFVGNELANDGDAEGNMFYALGEKRCPNFATCVDVLEGQADVNKNIMSKMISMRDMFATGKCDDASKEIDEIVRLMQIPLIQGVLRYAYRTETFEDPTPAMQAEGAAFAAGILPLVHKCNEQAARDIYDNMSLKPNMNTKADFSVVKSAFERVYGCLKVTCQEVGGIVNEGTGTSYVTGGNPCGGVNALSSAGVYTLSAVVGVIAAVAALVM